MEGTIIFSACLVTVPAQLVQLFPPFFDTVEREKEKLNKPLKSKEKN